MLTEMSVYQSIILDGGLDYDGDYGLSKNSHSKKRMHSESREQS